MCHEAKPSDSATPKNSERREIFPFRWKVITAILRAPAVWILSVFLLIVPMLNKLPFDLGWETLTLYFAALLGLIANIWHALWRPDLLAFKTFDELKNAGVTLADLKKEFLYDQGQLEALPDSARIPLTKSDDTDAVQPSVFYAVQKDLDTRYPGHRKFITFLLCSMFLCLGIVHIGRVCVVFNKQFFSEKQKSK